MCCAEPEKLQLMHPKYNPVSRKSTLVINNPFWLEIAIVVCPTFYFRPKQKQRPHIFSPEKQLSVATGQRN